MLTKKMTCWLTSNIHSIWSSSSARWKVYVQFRVIVSCPHTVLFPCIGKLSRWRSIAMVPARGRCYSLPYWHDHYQHALRTARCSSQLAPLMSLCISVLSKLCISVLSKLCISVFQYYSNCAFQYNPNCAFQYYPNGFIWMQSEAIKIHTHSRARTYISAIIIAIVQLAPCCHE